MKAPEPNQQPGLSDAERFDKAVGQILTVTPEEMARRQAAYEAEREGKPKPGPKRQAERRPPVE